MPSRLETDAFLEEHVLAELERPLWELPLPRWEGFTRQSRRGSRVLWRIAA